MLDLMYAKLENIRSSADKVRAIWGYPATMTFGEAVFAVPLIKAYKAHGKHMAYGNDMFNGGFAKIRRRFMGHKEYTGIDFTKFDKKLPRWLVYKAFKILASNIDFINSLTDSNRGQEKLITYPILKNLTKISL